MAFEKREGGGLSNTCFLYFLLKAPTIQRYISFSINFPFSKEANKPTDAGNKAQLSNPQCTPPNLPPKDNFQILHCPSHSDRRKQQKHSCKKPQNNIKLSTIPQNQ